MDYELKGFKKIDKIIKFLFKQTVKINLRGVYFI